MHALATEQAGDYILTYGVVAVFLAMGAVFAVIMVLAGALIRPKKRTSDKVETYECGEPALTGAGGRFNLRFWTVALVFVVFEVEIVVLYPVIAGYRNLMDVIQPVYLPFLEILVFVVILLVGLIYVWSRGDLDWVHALEEGPNPEEGGE